ncbi:hypothetical protein DFH09DRAFT_1088736 [Mycena vulgaris]|nr:hypothetical protein DFH09DRAFT_1088736 [Mycena vulgaris]
MSPTSTIAICHIPFPDHHAPEQPTTRRATSDLPAVVTQLMKGRYSACYYLPKTVAKETIEDITGGKNSGTCNKGNLRALAASLLWTCCILADSLCNLVKHHIRVEAQPGTGSAAARARKL